MVDDGGAQEQGWVADAEFAQCLFGATRGSAAQIVLGIWLAAWWMRVWCRVTAAPRVAASTLLGALTAAERLSRVVVLRVVAWSAVL